jgi:hypothetical protein
MQEEKKGERGDGGGEATIVAGHMVAAFAVDEGVRRGSKDAT